MGMSCLNTMDDEYFHSYMITFIVDIHSLLWENKIMLFILFHLFMPLLVGGEEDEATGALLCIRREIKWGLSMVGWCGAAWHGWPTSELLGLPGWRAGVFGGASAEWAHAPWLLRSSLALVKKEKGWRRQGKGLGVRHFIGGEGKLAMRLGMHSTGRERSMVWQRRDTGRTRANTGSKWVTCGWRVGATGQVAMEPKKGGRERSDCRL